MIEVKLKELRQERTNLSQNDMAARLDVKLRTYGSWERGEAMLNLEQAYNCAEILHCTIDEIAGREPPMTKGADPQQRRLNAYYESMNEKGKDALLDTARLMSGSPETRIEKDRPEHPAIQSAS